MNTDFSDVSIIVPAKKEEASIATCLQRVIASCPGAEVLLIDSGLDNTKEIFLYIKKYIKKELAFNSFSSLFYHQPFPDRGKGDAIRFGISKATRRIIVQLDADLQFFPEEIHLLVNPLLEDKTDMVLGSRFLKDKQSTDVQASAVRSLGNHLVSLWCSFLYRQKITDALAGLKAWKKEVTDSFTLTSYTYSYEIELFAKAIKKGWRVSEVPISTQARLHGQSTVNVLKAGFQLLRDAFLFRFFRL